ncbi:MAG: phosphoenolpyruvate--protein phosphotransferase [Nitrospinales bacterium]
MLKGIAVSKGISFGKTYLIDRSKVCIFKRQITPDQVEEEIKRFQEAIAHSKTQLQEIKKRAGKVGDKYSVILDTYSLLLEDEILVKDTVGNIRSECLNAEYALTLTLEKFMKLFDNINDEYLQGKKDDLELVVQRIIRNLVGHQEESLDEIDEPVVVIAHELRPTDMLIMNKSFIKGIATEAGGKTSHVGILASALGIPAVVGVKGITGKIHSGENIIIDGIDGHVIVNPNTEENKYYLKKQENFLFYEQKLLEDIKLAAETPDGCKIKLMANIESTHEIKSLQKFGAEGVGLYRTEFLYLGRNAFPSENELYENFKKVVQGVDPHPVVIRTLDIGGDKIMHTMDLGEENNPALGLRGIRLSLTYPEIFLNQIKAILRASLFGKVKILYPMVSYVDEIIEADKLLEQAKTELRAGQIPFDEEIEVGAMIETPASAVCVGHILEHVDFISIGTNDLIQYVLAVDRINENVAHLYQPFHPSVIKFLKDIFSAAEKAGKKVSVCGELGGDPLATQLILGLGKVDELSMVPHSIPKVKKIIRSINLDEAKQMADHVLGLSSTEEINRYITHEMRKKFPSDFDRDLSFEENIS